MGWVGSVPPSVCGGWWGGMGDGWVGMCVSLAGGGVVDGWIFGGRRRVPRVGGGGGWVVPCSVLLCLFLDW